MPTAVITGASQGLGRALATDLAAAGWTLVLDARTAPTLNAVARELGPNVLAIPGDVTDPEHRHAIAAAVGDRLDLLVLNASALGPSPLPPLAELGTAELRDVLETNVVAPHALLRLLLPALRAATGRVLTLSSDAAVSAYPGWGGYGASKAALDQLAAVLGAEEPLLLVYAVDPGDMRTAMHAAAFPGEDISDRPEPETIVPALRRLIDDDLPNGRYEASALLTPDGAADGAADVTPDGAADVTPDGAAAGSDGRPVPAEVSA